MMGEFDHIAKHAALPLHVQEAHEAAMESMISAAEVIANAYGCDTEEAWLRLAAVTKSVWQRIRASSSNAS